MIRWITDTLGTAAYDKVQQQPDMHVVDVRDLVDKTGNSVDAVSKKIEEALLHLKSGKKVVICCDYGMSRSNAVAAGVLSKADGIALSDAVRRTTEKIGEKAIKAELLSVVYQIVGEPKIKAASKMHILVTGGTGLIGSLLVNHLCSDARYKVFSPGRDQVDLTEGTVDLDIMVKEQQIDMIIHLANPRVYVTNSAMGETLVMLKNVLDVCRENRIKLIYPSGWEIYSGYSSQFLLASEFLPPHPKGIYGETKYLCEKLIEHYERQYGICAVLFRSGPVYGGGDRPKFIYNFFEKAFNGEDIIAHRYLNGFPCLDLLHINDLVTAVMHILDGDCNGTYHIGSGVGISTTEVAQAIVKILNSKSLVRHNEIQDFAPNIVMDITRLKDETGWTPQIKPEEGLALIKEYLIEKKRIL